MSFGTNGLERVVMWLFRHRSVPHPREVGQGFWGSSMFGKELARMMQARIVTPVSSIWMTGAEAAWTLMKEKKLRSSLAAASKTSHWVLSGIQYPRELLISSSRLEGMPKAYLKAPRAAAASKEKLARDFSWALRPRPWSNRSGIGLSLRDALLPRTH